MRLFIVLLCLCCSCSNETKVPDGILKPAQMEAILYDVIQADELVDFSLIQDSAYRVFSKRTALYDSLFHIHSITKEGFAKSLKFYQDRPDLLKTMLESLQKKADTTKVKQTDTIPIKPAGRILDL